MIIICSLGRILAKYIAFKSNTCSSSTQYLQYLQYTNRQLNLLQVLLFELGCILGTKDIQVSNNIDTTITPNSKANFLRFMYMQLHNIGVFKRLYICKYTLALGSQMHFLI